MYSSQGVLKLVFSNTNTYNIIKYKGHSEKIKKDVLKKLPDDCVKTIYQFLGTISHKYYFKSLGLPVKYWFPFKYNIRIIYNYKGSDKDLEYRFKNVGLKLNCFGVIKKIPYAFIAYDWSRHFN
jgi:hypothetical protein